MSIVDDTRKLLQDLIAPELRALQVQVSSLEKTMDARFSASEKTMDARFAAMSEKIDSQRDMLQAETRVLSATVTAQLALMTRTLQDIDGRLRRMEEDRRPGPGSAPASALPPAAA